MENIYSGSCLCGINKFEVQGKLESFYLCHCKYCQKDTGSAHAANVFSTNADLKWLTSTDLIQNFVLPTTRHTKSFCKNCGSALPNQQMDGALVVIPAGSLDTNLDIKPTAHIFCSSKASWENNLEDVKKIEGLPK